jgi:uncharacterized alpha-E superfamily protein
MLSRVADNLYWFSRYLRRVENTARLLGACSQLRLDLPRQVTFDLMPILHTMSVDELFVQQYGSDAQADQSQVLAFSVLSLDNPSSLRSSFNNARSLLRSIRDVMPQAIWDTVNDMHLLLEGQAAQMLERGREGDLFARIVDDGLKLSGLLNANVSRDIGFQFLRLGACLEQADMTSRIIDAGASGLIRARRGDELEKAYRSLQWAAVLSSLAGMQMFRRHMRRQVSAEAALSFLLQDNDFPRSVYFCLSRLLGVVPRLPHAPAVERQAHRVVGLVRNADPVWQAANNPALLMDEIQLHVAALDQAIAEGYFRQ